jgi:hypothetical protein
MSASGVHVCVEDETVGGIRVWGVINNDYFYEEEERLFGDIIKFDISNYKKAVMADGSFYRIDQDDNLWVVGENQCG